jgi:hypothetical protein
LHFVTTSSGGYGGAPRFGKAPDWMCIKCDNKNFGWREACNRCQVRGGLRGILVLWCLSCAVLRALVGHALTRGWTRVWNPHWAGRLTQAPKPGGGMDGGYGGPERGGGGYGGGGYGGGYGGGGYGDGYGGGGYGGGGGQMDPSMDPNMVGGYGGGMGGMGGMGGYGMGGMPGYGMGGMGGMGMYGGDGGGGYGAAPGGYGQQVRRSERARVGAPLCGVTCCACMARVAQLAVAFLCLPCSLLASVRIWSMCLDGVNAAAGGCRLAMDRSRVAAAGATVVEPREATVVPRVGEERRAPTATGPTEGD